MAANLFNWNQNFFPYKRTNFNDVADYYMHNPMMKVNSLEEAINKLGANSDFLQQNNISSLDNFLETANKEGRVHGFTPENFKNLPAGSLISNDTTLGFTDGKGGYYQFGDDYGNEYGLTHVVNPPNDTESYYLVDVSNRNSNRDNPPLIPNPTLFNPLSQKPSQLPRIAQQTPLQVPQQTLLNLSQTQNFNAPSPNILDYTQKQMREGVISAKQNYMAADNQIKLMQGLLDNPDGAILGKVFSGREDLFKDGRLTDAGRNAIQSYIDNLQMAKINANNYATMLRNSAKDIGIDLAGAGEENTLAEAQQKLFTENARAMRNLINLKPTAIQQREYYEQMRARGLSPYLARMAADQQHDSIRANNVQALRNGLFEFGVNEDGTMNSFGLDMLNKLADENPTAAQLFTSTLSNPKEAFNEANANYRQGLSLNANEKNQVRDIDYRMYALNKTLDAQERARQEGYNHDESMLRLRASMQKAGVPVDNMAREIQQIADNVTGGDTGKATEIYMRQHYDKLFANPEVDENGNIKMTDRDKVRNLVRGRFVFIENFLENGNYQSAKESIATYREKLQSDDFKYTEQLDAEDVKIILNQLDLYERVSDKEITLEEARRLMNQEPPNNSMGSFRQAETQDPYANIKARKIGETKAKELSENKPKPVDVMANTLGQRIIVNR